MKTVYIQTKPDELKIHNIDTENNTKTILSENDIDLIKDRFEYLDIYFINKKVDGYKTISKNADADIVLISDDNIDTFKTPLNDVYLLVYNETKFCENIIKIYNLVHGTIDLKFKYFLNYDMIEIEKQLTLLNHFLYQSFITDKITIIKQLTGFFIKDKFNDFGEDAFFIGNDMNVYSHPSFFYKNNKDGIISTVEGFDEDSEENIHFTRPHIICHCCECFYCDRDVYYNKIETSEFKTPAFEECKKNTMLNKYAILLFNNIQNNIEISPENLDIFASELNFEEMYFKLNKNEIITNRIKRINLNYLKTGHGP